MLLSWLVFCFFLRFMKLGDGRNVWFKIRWWISRLDVCFATRHWLDDQKLVVKRKTELGGTFSIPSWILFTGLFAALLYQLIAKRTIEVHNVKATNAPDLASFRNDVEFNMTAVSSMSCSNLRSPTTLLSGSSGFLEDKFLPISDILNVSCHNTSLGPTITLKCSNCRLNQDFMSISWQFVDLPNSPASAVGFQFNVTAKDHIRRDHVSFVSGTLMNGSNFDNSPVTFRGTDTNILIFNLFPRIYRSAKNLRLIQPLFHEFVPGSSLRNTSQLRASLENANDGVINTTLYVNYLSSYIIETENQNIIGAGSSNLCLMGVEVVDSDLAQLSIDKVTEVDKSFLHENGKLDKDPVYNNPIEVDSHNEEPDKEEENGAFDPHFPKDVVNEWPAPKQIHSFHFIRYRFYEDPAIKAKLDQADKKIRNYEKAKIEDQILAAEAAAKMGRG